MDEKVIYETALKKWGAEAQVNMLYEEVGELMSAINKLFRGRCTNKDVITELADVSIMVEQLSLLFGREMYENERESKLLRLKQRLGI